METFSRLDRLEAYEMTLEEETYVTGNCHEKTHLNLSSKFHIKRQETLKESKKKNIEKRKEQTRRAAKIIGEEKDRQETKG